MTRRLTRRRFLSSASAGAAALLFGCGRRSPVINPGNVAPSPKLILLQFGGGTRSSETVDDPEHRHIPGLWGELVPRGTLFTDARVEHRVVHPNATGSIMTGHWEWDDLDWTRPVAHPTIFEVYRKARNAPDTDAWVFAYASILAKTGESTAAGWGAPFAANVVTPPTIPRAAAREMETLMRRVAQAPTGDGLEAARQAAAVARRAGRIARDGLRSDEARGFVDEAFAAWQRRPGSTSHDAFLTDCAIACMERFAPGVMAIDYGEIDCAHYGSWSRYVEAIRRTDTLVHKVWRKAEALPAYRGQTLMLILPDHGRQLDGEDGFGFVHHSDFYTDKGADEGCRRVWMLVLGPGVVAGRTIRTSVPITAAAATGLEYLGLDPSKGAADSVLALAK